MNIFHTLVIKVASVVSAVLIFVGVSTPTEQPTITTVDIQSNEVVEVKSVKIEQKSATSTEKVQESTILVKNGVEIATTTQQESPKPTQEQQVVPIYIVTTPPAQTSPPKQEILPTSQPLITQTQKPMTFDPSITIKNPIPSKGIRTDVEYLARATPLDEKNEVFIGAIVTGSEGNVLNDVDVTVTATDGSQDKVINGTGNISTFGDVNNPKYYYPFTYTFYFTGKHVITFTALGVSQSIEVTIDKEDTR